MPSETYILILSPREHGNWPAVIGGYSTREAAEDAGREATMAHLTQEQFETEGFGFNGSAERRELWKQWLIRPWRAFTVIQGNVA